MGKKGDRGAQARASAFLLNPSLVPKLFNVLAERYCNRPGGYTRIHKFGNRPGDNAPRAILELVDNPRDLRLEMTSRAIGWEILKDKLKIYKPVSVINSGVDGVQKIVESELSTKLGEPSGVLRPKTRWNLQKILRFRDHGAAQEVSQKVRDHMVSATPLTPFLARLGPDAFKDHLLATPVAFRSLHDEAKERHPQNRPARTTKAGQLLPGETRPALTLARGALGHHRPQSTSHRLSVKAVFGRKYRDT